MLWNKFSVAWLLTNLTYTGQVVIKGQAFPGSHPPIISQELYDEVQAIRRRHRYMTSTYLPKYRTYLFNGIMYCSGCRRKMRALATSGRPNGTEPRRCYRCTAHQSERDCPKPEWLIRAEILEDQFTEIVRQLRLPGDWRERIREMMAQNGKVRNVEDDRKRLKEKLNRLKWLYTEGDLGREEYIREKHEIESRLASLVIPQEREVMDAGTYLETMADIWEEATMKERREMVFTLLSAVVCDPAEKRIIALRPKPTFMLFFRQNPNLLERNGTFEVRPG